jgi:predicted nucleotidyltransferase
MTQFGDILNRLADANVEFIVVGGVAAIAHGSARATQDIDVVYRRTKENLTRIVEVMRPHAPYPRGAPPGLPFMWDARTLAGGLNFTLTTSLGAIDLLGEITGGGGYDELLPFSVELPLFGSAYRFLDIEKLILVKRAAGRPKDFEALAELESIRDERNNPPR